MVSPVSNFGKRYTLSAFKRNGSSGGAGSGTDLGSYGSPPANSTLSWNGETLNLVTSATSYMRMTVDVSYVVYDGGSITFNGAYFSGS